MLKFFRSLQFKLTVSFVVLILVISGFTFFGIYRSATTAIKATLQHELIALASVSAANVDGDVLEKLKPGDENTPEFKSIRDSLYNIQKSDADIQYVYTMKKQGEEMSFVVDAEYGYEEDSPAIGEAYKETTPAMYAGFNGVSVEEEFSTDKWGTFLSGYVPIKNSKEVVVGMLGVDMLADKVLMKQSFVEMWMYGVLLTAIFLAGVIVLLFTKTIIRDIKKLNKAAEEISMGKIDADVKVERKDEIGELAESFQRMITSLRIMRLYPNDKKKKNG